MNSLVRGRRTVTAVPAKDKIRANDLLNRNFFTDAPDKVWITDFTYVPTRIGVSRRAYHDLWLAKASFRATKSDLRTRRLVNRERESFDAHLTVQFAALVACKHLQELMAFSLNKWIKYL